MSLLRVFVALSIPAPLQEAIQRETAGLQQRLGRRLVRWVAPENVHLTLKFLGEISRANVDLLIEALRREAGEHPAFEMTVGGLGVFPNPRRPRVVWIGLQAPPALDALQHAIEAAAARLGYPEEERPFSPHLTIGRVSQHASGSDQQRIRQAIEATTVGALGTAAIRSVELYRSDLRPEGPLYTRLHSAALRPPTT